MKHLIPSVLLQLLPLLAWVADAGAQPVNDSVLLNTPLYREHLQLYTDRNLYAAGERVHFRLFNLSHPWLKEGEWSKVVYLELINNRNKPVARGKYRFGSSGSRGQMGVPDSLSTGQYHLRAYTRWMRNFSPSAYASLPLAVVNAQKVRMEDLSPGNEAPGMKAPFNPWSEGILCTPDKAGYGKREMVTITFRRDSNLVSADGYCISVVQKGTLDEGYPYLPGPGIEERLPDNGLLYPPETRGISATGHVVSRETGSPVAFAGMNMTLLGSDQDHVGFVTDGNGRFLFSIPHHFGNTDALITPDANGGNQVEIRMDEEYSSAYSSVQDQHVDFFRERGDLVEQILVRSQLNKVFTPEAREGAPFVQSGSGYVFYGTPEFRYRTDDYVALPNMEEFLFELIPQVQVINYRDKRYMVVTDDYGIISNYPPLILLDHVPLQDVESFLPVPPRLIDCIDIVNRVYIRGSNTYGGIISIRTREGDRAGIPLPSGSAFIPFSTFEADRETHFPEYPRDVPGERIPDLRTTLYWSAQEDLAAGKEKAIRFYTSDLSGEYMVVIRGVTGDGKLLRGVCAFTVE